MDEFSSARPNEEGVSQSAQCKAYVLSHFAFWITASQGAQSHNTIVSSRFMFHGVPNPRFPFVQQQVHRLSCYGCVLLCVSRHYEEVLEPNSRGHTEAWESITPTRGATPRRGSPSPQLKGPRQGVGIHHPNSRGRLAT